MEMPPGSGRNINWTIRDRDICPVCVGFKIIYLAPCNPAPAFPPMFYNTTRYLLWVACMGTHNNDDTHTVFFFPSIVKYDACAPRLMPSQERSFYRSY